MIFFPREFRFVVPRRCFLERLKKIFMNLPSFVVPVSLSLNQKTLSEHSFSNSSLPVLRRNCFSATHFLPQVAVHGPAWIFIRINGSVIRILW